MAKKISKESTFLPTDALGTAVKYLFDRMLNRGTIRRTMQTRGSVLLAEYRRVENMRKTAVNPPTPEEVTELFCRWSELYPFPPEMELTYMNSPSGWFYNYDMVLQHWQIESNNLRKREITEAAKQLLADKEMVDFTEYIYRAVHESKWAIEDWEVRHGLIAESLIVYQRWLDSDTFRQYPQNVQDSFVLPDILILYYTTRPQPIKDRVSGVVSAGWLTGVADRRKTEYFGVYV